METEPLSKRVDDKVSYATRREVSKSRQSTRRTCLCRVSGNGMFPSPTMSNLDIGLDGFELAREW